MGKLIFEKLSEVAVKRSNMLLFQSKVDPLRADIDFVKLYFASKLAEEAGEVNAEVNKSIKGLSPKAYRKLEDRIKKEDGVEFVPAYVIAQRAKEIRQLNLAEELSDVIVTALLLANAANIDIEPAIIKKFNERSEELSEADFQGRVFPKIEL